MSKTEQELIQDLETMKRRHLDLLNESQTMKAKVICLETEKSDAYSQLRKYKDALIAHRRELTGLQEHLHVKKDLENQIENHKRQIAELQADLGRMRDLLKDTETDMRNYQSQCQDSMDLIEKLTSNNVDLKVKVTEFSTELDALNSSHKVLREGAEISRKALAVSEEKIALITQQLLSEQESRRTERDLSSATIAENEAIIQRLGKDCEDSQNEKRLTGRMYQATLKDLKRELAAATRLNGQENGKGDHDSSDKTSLRSRASSSSSLDHSPIFLHGSASCHALSSNLEEPTVTSPPPSDPIDRSVLIDKIVRLQRELAKKDEKVDFLEDHVAMLTFELKKRPK